MHRTIAIVALLLVYSSSAFSAGPDFNGDGEINFADFLILSGNFGMSPAVHADGDANGDSSVGFADFLILSGQFGSETIMVSTNAELADLNSQGFQDNRSYILMTDSFENFTDDLVIDGASGTVLCFSHDFEGDVIKFTNKITASNCTSLIIANLNAIDDVEFSPGADPSVAYGDDYGVVNIVDSTATLLDCKIENTRRYQIIFGPDLEEDTADDVAENLRNQSSCALNIADSTVTVSNAEIISHGKSTVLVHDGSDVTMNVQNGGELTISGAYFELNVGASDLEVNDARIVSDLQIPDTNGDLKNIYSVGYTDKDGVSHSSIGDRHPPINASASYGTGDGGPAARNSNIQLNNVTFDLKNGAPIVTGSADAQTDGSGDFYVSSVHLNNCDLDFRGPPQFGVYGLVGYADNWHSISLTRTGGRIMTASGFENITTSGNPERDLQNFTTTVETANYSKHPGNTISGFGKFVFYQPAGSQIANTFTVNPLTGVFSSLAHPFDNGRRVKVWTSNTLPGNLNASATYFIVNATADTFQLATTEGGSPISVNNGGVGTHQIGHSPTAFEIDVLAPNRTISSDGLDAYSVNPNP